MYALKNVVLLSLLMLTGCQFFGNKNNTPSQNDQNVCVQQGDTYQDVREKREGKIFDHPITLNGPPASQGPSINPTLWRAALDTVSFMPFSSADPWGGVIITEWYSPIHEPTERFKVDIIVLGSTIRPDAIRVSLHKQRINAQGQWRSIESSDESVRELEDAILARARELKNSRGSF